MPRPSIFRLPSAILSLAIPAAALAQPTTPPRPNILILSAEDLSPDLACYGDTNTTTPNLDRLAQEGTLFTKAFSTAPVCSPSRCSIITGMYATSVGGHNHRSDVVPPTGVKPFSEYLRAAGYYCTNNAKTDYNFPPPLTAWDQNGPHAHYANRPDKSQPFFAVFNSTITHESQVMGIRGNRVADPDDAATTADSLDPAHRHDPAKITLPPYYPDTPKVRANVARYYDLITLLDRQIKSRLDELESAGLADNTIVLFWGDHGRSLPRGKRWAYDSGLRVPLIVRWPKHLQPGSKRDDLATLMDLAPTFLSLAGAEVPKYMQGRILLGPATQPAPQYVFATRDRMDEVLDQQRSARDTRYRYTRNLHPDLPYAQKVRYAEQSPVLQEWRRLHEEGKLNPIQSLFFAPTKPAEELYDLDTDPHEVHNLATDPAHEQTLQRFRTAVDKWAKDTNDPGTTPEETLQKQMRPTGKKETVAPPTATLTDNKLTLSTPTEGASIAWTTDQTPRPHWRLYTTPLPTPEKPLRFLAVRPGFLNSKEASYKPE